MPNRLQFRSQQQWYQVPCYATSRGYTPSYEFSIRVFSTTGVSANAQTNTERATRRLRKAESSRQATIYIFCAPLVLEKISSEKKRPRVCAIASVSAGTRFICSIYYTDHLQIIDSHCMIYIFLRQKYHPLLISYDLQ